MRRLKFNAQKGLDFTIFIWFLKSFRLFFFFLFRTGKGTLITAFSLHGPTNWNSKIVCNVDDRRRPHHHHNHQASWADENLPRADLDSSLWKIISTFEMKFLTAMSWDMLPSWKVSKEASEDETKRRIQRCPNWWNREFTCYLTHLTNLQPRECPHVAPLKDGPIYEYSKHHSHDVERDPHQTKASFKQKEWQHRTRIRRSLVLAHDSLDTFNNSRAFIK